MPYRIPDSEIERWIDEDLPYGDLTTHLLGIGDRPGRIVFTSRERIVACCTEEAGRLLDRCGAKVTELLPSGTAAESGTVLLGAEGSAASLHAGWKAAMNLVEYASGIATRTRLIVDRARSENPSVSIVTTRKSFPGTKKLSIKAIMAGGALPHRLGLSESILVFAQHTALFGGLEPFLGTIADLKKRAPEQRTVVEAASREEALAIVRAGADIVQVDKLGVEALADLVREIRAISPGTAVSAAGGITADNVAAYAATGVDIIVLSSVYFGRPADIGATITSNPNHRQP